MARTQCTSAGPNASHFRVRCPSLRRFSRLRIIKNLNVYHQHRHRSAAAETVNRGLLHNLSIYLSFISIMLFLNNKLSNEYAICALKEEPTEKENSCNFDAPMAAIKTLATVGSCQDRDHRSLQGASYTPSSGTQFGTG